MNKHKIIWLSIFSAIFVIVQGLIIGMILGIISLASNGGALSTGSFGGDLALTIVCALLLPNIILGLVCAYWYVNRKDDNQQDNKNSQPNSYEPLPEQPAPQNNGDVNETNPYLPKDDYYAIDAYWDIDSFGNAKLDSQEEIVPKNLIIQPSEDDGSFDEEVSPEDKTLEQKSPEQVSGNNEIPNQPKKSFFEKLMAFPNKIEEKIESNKLKNTSNGRLDVVPEQIVEPRNPVVKNKDNDELVKVKPLPKQPLSKKVKSIFKKNNSDEQQFDDKRTTSFQPDDGSDVKQQKDIETQPINKPTFTPLQTKSIKFKVIDDDSARINAEESKLEDIKKELSLHKNKLEEQKQQEEQEASRLLELETAIKEKEAQLAAMLKEEEKQAIKKQKEEAKAKTIEQQVISKEMKYKIKQDAKELKRLEKEELKQKKIQEKQAAKAAKLEEDKKVQDLAYEEALKQKEDRQAQEIIYSYEQEENLKQKQNKVAKNKQKIEELEEAIKQKQKDIANTNERIEKLNESQENEPSYDYVESEYQPIPDNIYEAQESYTVEEDNLAPEDVEIVPQENVAPEQKKWISHISQDEIYVFAPFDGKVLPLTEVPDPIFSQGIAGQGLAIIPSSYDVRSIVNSGTLSTIYDSKNIYTFDCEGIEIMLNIGIESSNLGDSAFSIKAEPGISVDLKTEIVSIKEKKLKKAKSKISPIVVPELHGREIQCVVYEQQDVKQGDLLFVIK